MMIKKAEISIILLTCYMAITFFFTGAFFYRLPVLVLTKIADEYGLCIKNAVCRQQTGGKMQTVKQG